MEQIEQKFEYDMAFESIRSDLKRLLLSIQTSQPESLVEMAKKLDIPVEQIEKMLSGSLSKIPKVSSLISIINMAHKEFRKSSPPGFFAKRIHPQLNGPVLDLLKEKISKVRQVCEFTDFRINSILSDPVNTLILLMASTHKGVNRDSVKKLIGEVGIKNLLNLENQDILLKMGNQFFLEKEYKPIFEIHYKKTLRSIFEVIPDAGIEFKDQGSENQSISTESINDDGIEALRKEFTKLNSRIKQIHADPKYRGHKTVVFTSFLQEL